MCARAGDSTLTLGGMEYGTFDRLIEINGEYVAEMIGRQEGG